MNHEHFRIRDLSATSPVILHAPHGGRLLAPEHLAAFVISPEELEVEKDLMTDHFTDILVERIAGASTVINDQSRLALDVERFPDDSEEMNAVGMGVLYTHGSRGQRIRDTDFADRAELMEEFDTYSEAFATLVDATVAAHERAIIIDVHSFPLHALPYELHGDQLRPELCIGFEPFHAPADLVIAARTAFPQLHALVNQPFAGSYVPLRHYYTDARVQSVMLEIRRDTYMDEQTMTLRREPFDALADSLQALVNAVGGDSSPVDMGSAAHRRGERHGWHQGREPDRPACPICGTADPFRFAYGLVHHEFFETAEEKRLVAGGCVIMDDSPDFRCGACGFEWGNQLF